MRNPFRTGLNAEFDQLCLADVLQRDSRMREAASVLALIGTGLHLSHDDSERLIDTLANTRDIHGIQPDDIQAALLWHEPSLETGNIR